MIHPAGDKACLASLPVVESAGIKRNSYLFTNRPVKRAYNSISAMALPMLILTDIDRLENSKRSFNATTERAVMYTCARATVAFIALFLVGAAAAAQSGARDTKSEKEPTATIAGRVTLKGKGAAGVIIALLPAEPVPQRGVSVRTTADEDGRYRFTAVAAGRYTITPLAPPLITPRLLLGGTLASGSRSNPFLNSKQSIAPTAPTR